MYNDRRPGLFWPLILIGLGALLLLQNLGYLPAGLWPALAQLWPVIFILLVALVSAEWGYRKMRGLA